MDFLLLLFEKVSVIEPCGFVDFVSLSCDIYTCFDLSSGVEFCGMRLFQTVWQNYVLLTDLSGVGFWN